MRHKGKHRAHKDSLRVKDIKAALYAEQDWTDALFYGPITVPAITAYLEGAA